MGSFDNASNSKTLLAVKDFLGSKTESGWLVDDERIPDVVIQIITRESLFAIDNWYSTGKAGYRAIHNLLVLNGSKDFTNDINRIDSFKPSQLQDHHIFPKKFLKMNGIGNNEINTILNRTLISITANEKIKDNPPHQYLIADSSIIGRQFSQSDVFGHCIDLSTIEHGFDKDKYKKFKERRKELILDLIMNQIG